MSSVTVNGVIYTDDDNATTGLANGGHRTRLVPMLSNAVVDLQAKVTAAQTQVSLATGQVALAVDQVAIATAQAVASGGSAITAAAHLADMVALYDQFDDRYLGAKAADPALDNDGNALANGAFYINTATGYLRAYTVAGGWVQGISSVSGVSSLNSLTGAVVLKTVNDIALTGAGNIAVTSTGSTLFLASNFGAF
ncbi:hypothetical protein [Polaromonas sp.]|uniref:hypothetical protein n=1 Tax=Polaromonas sp. TaxID=1869339 RepID=UPI0035618D84